MGEGVYYRNGVVLVLLSRLFENGDWEFLVIDCLFFFSLFCCKV